MQSNRAGWGLVVCCLSLLSARALRAEQAQPPEPPLNLKWTHGPTPIELGTLATINLPSGIAFCGPDDARKLLERQGNIPNKLELGIVIPDVEGQDWFVIFRHHDVGYIRDDEKDKIDADAILKSISEGTEEANKVRKERGIPGLHVVAWKEAPHYDGTSHHFVWSILARDDEGHEVINYNVRMLGREGYVSATLVDAPAGFDAARPRLDKVMDGFAFSKGRSYAEFRAGDKVAEYGLTALVAAGAGAAAVKFGLLGLLAKAWKAVAVGLLAMGAAIVNGLKSLFRSRQSREPREPPDQV